MYVIIIYVCSNIEHASSDCWALHVDYLYFISHCNCWLQAAEKLKVERGEAFDLAADAKGSE